jgi:two-component system, OmpR family, sensor histidine kinase QseC
VSRIEVVCRPQARDGATAAMLGVRDDGPGVPSADRERIFDRFYRVPGSASRGSGIGLSLVARIAQLHGTVIDVGEGLDGRGLGITVRFMTADSATTASSAAPEPSSVMPGLGVRHAA